MFYETTSGSGPVRKILNYLSLHKNPTSSNESHNFKSNNNKTKISSQNRTRPIMVQSSSSSGSGMSSNSPMKSSSSSGSHPSPSSSSSSGSINRNEMLNISHVALNQNRAQRPHTLHPPPPKPPRRPLFSSFKSGVSISPAGTAKLQSPLEYLNSSSSIPDDDDDDDDDDDNDDHKNNNTDNSNDPAASSDDSSNSSLSDTTSVNKKKSTAAIITAPVKTVLCCDKCDGKHETDDCPYYKKTRESHPDAQKSTKHLGGSSSLPGALLRSARVVRQPGDGSCLFHSISYGLRDGSSSSSLRNEICQFILNNPVFKISDTPLSDWVRWDSGGASCRDYVSRMSRGAWGGGIEMSVAAHIKNINLHVYEQCRGGYKRISAFDHAVDPESRPIVRVLYCGGVHYDALISNS